MAMITAFVDAQDANGNSVVVANPDGTRSPLVLKLASGLTATYAKSGDLGIVSVAPDGSAASTVSSLTVSTPGAVPPQYQIVPVAPVTVTTAVVYVQALTVPPGRGIQCSARIACYIYVPALGFWTWGWTSLVIATANGGLGLPSSPASNADAANDFMGAPFDPGGFGAVGSGSSLSIGVNPINLTTPYTGTSMPSGAWAQNKVVTGTVQGSGTALGLGSSNTILAAGGHWYFYTAGTTSNSGSGPTHTSGSAADGSATAYYGGTVSGGVPVVVTITVDEIKEAGIA